MTAESVLWPSPAIHAASPIPGLSLYAWPEPYLVLHCCGCRRGCMFAFLIHRAQERSAIRYEFLDSSPYFSGPLPSVPVDPPHRWRPLHSLSVRSQRTWQCIARPRLSLHANLRHPRGRCELRPGARRWLPALLKPPYPRITPFSGEHIGQRRPDRDARQSR